MKLSTLFLNSWDILLHVILMKKLFVSKLSVKLNMIFVCYVVGSLKWNNYERKGEATWQLTVIQNIIELCHLQFSNFVNDLIKGIFLQFMSVFCLV